MDTITWIIGIAVVSIVNIVFAIICWKFAGNRDRSRIGWAILGFLFPVIALVVLLIIGKKKPKIQSA